MIQTNSVDYWGFRTHPFADYILRGDSLRLFVDREEELFDVEDALGYSRVVGVHGSLGVGKSSFLQKLREDLIKGQKAVAFVHLTADSRDTLYREVLKEVLQFKSDANDTDDADGADDAGAKGLTSQTSHSLCEVEARNLALVSLHFPSPPGTLRLTHSKERNDTPGRIALVDWPSFLHGARGPATTQRSYSPYAGRQRSG